MGLIADLYMQERYNLAMTKAFALGQMQERFRREYIDLPLHDCSSYHAQKQLRAELSAVTTAMSQESIRMGRVAQMREEQERANLMSRL